MVFYSESLILNLPDEILDIITASSRESVAFLSRVCTRLCQSENRTRRSETRRCDICSAFYSTNTLNEALKENEFNIIVRDGNLWTTAAQNAAMCVGSSKVVQLVFLEDLSTENQAYLRGVCKWNRLDIMLSNDKLRLFCRSNMSALSCYSPQSYPLRNFMQAMGVPFFNPTNQQRSLQMTSVRHFISQVIVPAFRGGSVDVLRWLFNTLNTSRLGRGCVWSQLLTTKTSRVPRMLVRAAQSSENSENALEFLSHILSDVHVDIERVRRHVAAFAISIKHQCVTLGTLIFANRCADTLSRLIHSVNTDVSNGVSIVHTSDTRVFTAVHM